MAMQLIPKAYAQIDPCPFTSQGLNCFGNPAGYLGSLTGNAIGVFAGVLGAMLILFTIKLALGARDEGQLTETKQAYGHALLGAILIVAAGPLANSFTTNVADGFIDEAVIRNDVLGQIALFLIGIVDVALVVNLTFQGARLIIAQEQGQMDTARKSVFSSMIAVAVALLASNVATAFMFPNTSVLSAEFVGIANFLITVFGALAVIAVIVSGLMLVLSADESLKDRAKKTLIAAIVAMVVVIASASIVSIF